MMDGFPGYTHAEESYSPPVCIGINGAINGVWLPKTSGPNVPITPASPNLSVPPRVFQNQTFSPRYNFYVLGLLTAVRGNKTGVEIVLKDIRRQLLLPLTIATDVEVVP
jgi:hypothetical protein